MVSTLLVLLLVLVSDSLVLITSLGPTTKKFDDIISRLECDRQTVRYWTTPVPHLFAAVVHKLFGQGPQTEFSKPSGATQRKIKIVKLNKVFK